ncbi:MAG: DMT family transporter [Alphaproteobacteria bacterium]|nr:DMT family transporter [Alphaproteobacteria bacterium]
MSTPPRPLIGWLAACGLLLIWSGWVVISRLGVTQTLTIYDMAMLRFAVAAIAVAPFLVHYWPRNLVWWKIGVLSCGPGIPYVLFAFAGMKFAPASHAGVLMNGTLPILAAIVGLLWLNERPGHWKIIGMIIILSGCLLIGWDRSSVGIEPDAWIGHLFFVGSALMLAGYMIATKAWHVTAMQALVVIPVVNAVFYGPIYLAFLPTTIGAASWAEILLQGLYQGLGPSILGVVFFTTAIRAIGPTPTAAVMAGVPGLAALMAIPVLGEWPSLFAWIGLGLASVGILLTAGWHPARRTRARVVEPISR